MGRRDLELVVEDWARRFYSKRMRSIRDLFKVGKAIIGMIHLLPCQAP